MRRCSFVLALVVATACGSFDPIESPSATSDAGLDGTSAPDTGSAVDAGGSADTGGPQGACTSFTEHFDSWVPKPGGWGSTANAGATVTIGSGWNGPALSIHYNAVAAGNPVNAFASHSFSRTDPSCPLTIAFDMRVRPTTDGSWFVFMLQGSASGKVTIGHQGSFWYLNAGNTRQQISFAPDNVVGHVQLVLQRSGAHDVVTYSNGVAMPVTIDDLQTVIGDGVDIQLGGQVQGATSGANEAEIDDLVVTW